MQTPAEFARDYLRANSFYTSEYSYQVLSDDDGYELSLLIAARDAEIRRECAEKRNEGCDGCEWRLSRSACMACSRSFADRYKRAEVIGEEE